MLDGFSGLSGNSHYYLPKLYTHTLPRGKITTYTEKSY